MLRSNVNMQPILIQGVEASFHHIAAQTYFGSNVKIIPKDSFREVFADLSAHQAPTALVAIENSLYGSINEVYDLLLKHDCWILGEIYQRIEHHLIGLPGATLKNIQEVFSHPVALAQCEEFLNTKLVKAKRFEHQDTAASVCDVKAWNDPKKAAIASRSAAEINQMKILVSNIETNRQNYTRFIVIQTAGQQPFAGNKASLILRTSDTPGALHAALGVFAKHNLNLTKLQSRPIIGNAWHYMFYADIESPQLTSKLDQALVDLKSQGASAKVLGVYEKAPY